MSKETKTTNLIGARVDENDILNSMFTNDKDRIKFNSRAFATMSIAKAFAKTYGIELSEDVKKKWAEQIPLRRGGTPDDVANVAVFLASDLSAYVTGEVIPVTGGM